jgi:hypothetical protein
MWHALVRGLTNPAADRQRLPVERSPFMLGVRSAAVWFNPPNVLMLPAGPGVENAGEWLRRPSIGALLKTLVRCFGMKKTQESRPDLLAFCQSC